MLNNKMIRATVLPNPREGISHDEILRYSFSVLQPEYRTPEKLREYATLLLKSNIIDMNYSKDQLESIQSDIYPKIEGDLYEMVYSIGRFPKGKLVKIASTFGIIAEDLLPYDKSPGKEERFALAYENITGKECSLDEVCGPPKFAGGLVIEPLLDLL